jgi:hypothetical protein
MAFDQQFAERANALGEIFRERKCSEALNFWSKVKC